MAGTEDIGPLSIVRRYMKPVGASDGCGTEVVDIGGMQNRISELEAENAKLREALENVIDAWKYQDPDQMREIARAALSKEDK